MRVLVPVTGAFHGRLRVRRSTGELDTEGLERVLSDASAQAIGLATGLRGDGAHVVAVHIDKGGGEEVLREALALGADQGILIEGAVVPSDASVRAATIADVYRQNGPFDLIVGPAVSEFGGFTGTLAALAGELDLPCVHGVESLQADEEGLRVRYASIFGRYVLRIPRPSVVMVGDAPRPYPDAWGIADAHRDRGILRVQADQYAATAARTKRVRIESTGSSRRSPEEVDPKTLVRRLRSRALLPEVEEDTP